MHQKQERSQGFAAVEFLLVLIIIILIAFMGWFIYHTDHKKTDTSVKNTSSNSGSTKSTSAPTSYFSISQWGVRAPYSGNLTLEDTVSSDGSYASFSSEQLDSADASCKSAGNGGGQILRYAATADIQNEDGSSSGLTPQQALENGEFGGLNGGEYANVGNYYYFYQHPQGLCGSSAQSVQNIETATASAVEALVSHLEASP